MNLIDNKEMSTYKSSIPQLPTDGVRNIHGTKKYIATQNYTVMFPKIYTCTIRLRMPLADIICNSVGNNNDKEYHITVDQ